MTVSKRRNQTAPLLATALTLACACTLYVVLPSEATDRQRELPVVRPDDPLMQAADFELADLGGDRIRLSAIDKPVILLHFWTKFRECEDELELLQRLDEKYADDDVMILSAVYSSGSRDEVLAFMEELGVSIPTVMCTREVLRKYDVSTFPTTFLLDGDHNIRYWMYGILVEEHWDKLVAELLEAETAGAK